MYHSLYTVQYSMNIILFWFIKVNGSEDQISKFATSYTPHDVDFFRKVVIPAHFCLDF